MRGCNRLITLALALLVLAVAHAARDYTPRPRPTRRIVVHLTTGQIGQVEARGDLIGLFKAAGARYKLDWRLLLAQCWKESNFVLNARGAAGERGMAQFMPATWAIFGRGDPDNPQNAVEAQALYLAYIRGYLARRGITDPRMTIAGYNCGEGCAAAAGRFESLPPGVRGYTADVWRRYQYLQAVWR
jgi:soluble lytic murein transglycosylase-like protein